MNWSRGSISEFSGRRNLEGYTILCFAVEEACEMGVDGLKMGDLVKRIQAKMPGNKTTSSISKALSRVTADIWDHGNKDALIKLCGYERSEKPSPKELIIRLAETVSKPSQVEYVVQKETEGTRFGVFGRSAGGHAVAVAPFSSDRLGVELFVDLLNRRQIPLEEFADYFCSGEFFLKE